MFTAAIPSPLSPFVRAKCSTIVTGLFVALTVALLISDAAAQSARMAPLDRLPTDQAPHVSTAAKPDSWTLQTLGEVTLHSPIVRLRDIVLPVGIPDAVWEKIGPAAVTLVPTDGRRLTIERQRLLEYVQRHLTPEQRIRWTGPESIYVQYEGQVREVAFPTGPQTAPSITPPKTVHKIATENPARQAV
ncbi:MAG: hypothetical protein WD119_02510, partial [Pirellulaceae bacterium]